MVMENQQLFALSLWDFLWKIIPHFSIYACLNSIRSLVRPRSNMYTVHCDQPSQTTASMTVSPMNKDEHQPSTPMEDGSVPDMPRHVTPNANAERLLRRLQVELTLWGAWYPRVASRGCLCVHVYHRPSLQTDCSPTEIKEFPPTLMKLPVDDLSLIGTDIVTLPEFPPDHPGFFTLAMTRTPLKALPTNFGDTRTIGFLSLGYTQLSQFPSWMPSVARTADKVYVHHTPFCEGLSPETREKEYGENAALTCSAKDDRVDGKYPLAIMAPRRLL